LHLIRPNQVARGVGRVIQTSHGKLPLQEAP
jgi:hypothetical protein